LYLKRGTIQSVLPIEHPLLKIPKMTKVRGGSLAQASVRRAVHVNESRIDLWAAFES
jgi:hypothetical protein